MNAKKSFKEFRDELSSAFPDTKFAPYKDTDPADFEELITPVIMKVMQKDKTLFDEEFTIFDVNVSPLFPQNPDMFWKNIQKCGIAAFLGGDIKEKMNKIAESLKTIWGGSGHSTDEIEKLLGTEESRSKVSEILEFVMTTRLAKVVMSLVESIDITELGIDFENPEELLKSFQAEEISPVMEKLMKKIKATLEEKVRRGEFTKEMLAADIETIKVKIQAAFGDMFMDMLGGRKADVESKVILSNSPEARRARMLARMQRKVAERKAMD
jgi:hypothetical protein